MVNTSPPPSISFPEVDLFSFFFNRPAGDEPPFSATKTIFLSSTSPDRSYSYAQLFDLSRAFATLLQHELTFQPGQTLALITPNDIDMVPTMLGTWYSGGAITPMNPLFSAAEMAAQLRDSGASVIVTHASILDTTLAAADLISLPHHNILLLGETADPRQRIPHWRSPSTSITSTPPNPQIPIHNPRSAVALLPYSSGTTGTPKGVVLTHHNLTSNLLQIATAQRPYFSWAGGAAHDRIAGVPAAAPYDAQSGHGGDRALVALPLFHIYGLAMGLLLALRTGTLAVVMVMETPFDVFAFGDAVTRYTVTKVYIVPPLARLLVREAERLDARLGARWGESLRVCYCGAAPLGRALIEALRARWGWRVIQAYGLTECSPGVAQQGLEDCEEGKGSVGRVFGGMELRVVGLAGAEGAEGQGEEVQDGEDGELVIRGPNVFTGYLNRDDATRACLSSDGWLRTGDVGHVQKGTGRLYVTDRVTDIIKYHGFQITPSELEGVLLECQMVDDVAVVGIWDEERQTEVPRAFCVRNGGRDAVSEGDDQVVVEWVQSKVIEYKWLTGGVEWVDELPRSASGKVMRGVLRDRQRNSASSSLPKQVMDVLDVENVT